MARERTGGSLQLAVELRLMFRGRLWKHYEIFSRNWRESAALGHFNVAELVALKAVIAAADETKVPVFICVSEGERDFLGVRQLAALVKSTREESSLPVFLNADHRHWALHAGNSSQGNRSCDETISRADRHVSRDRTADWYFLPKAPLNHK